MTKPLNHHQSCIIYLGNSIIMYKQYYQMDTIKKEDVHHAFHFKPRSQLVALWRYIWGNFSFMYKKYYQMDTIKEEAYLKDQG